MVRWNEYCKPKFWPRNCVDQKCCTLNVNFQMVYKTAPDQHFYIFFTILTIFYNVEIFLQCWIFLRKITIFTIFDSFNNSGKCRQIFDNVYIFLQFWIVNNLDNNSCDVYAKFSAFSANVVAMICMIPTKYHLIMPITNKTAVSM